jgi:hypothetical protein
MSCLGATFANASTTNANTTDVPRLTWRFVELYTPPSDPLVTAKGMDLQIRVSDAAAAGERSFSVAVIADQGALQVGANYALLPTYPATATAPGYAMAAYSDSRGNWAATTGAVVIDAIDWPAYHSGDLLGPLSLHMENAHFAPPPEEGDRPSIMGTFVLDIEGSVIALASGSR